MMSVRILFVMSTILVIHAGCSSNVAPPSDLAAGIAAKADTVGQRIGGEDGFGGTLMDGYLMHMEDHMGFHDEDDLAASGEIMMVDLENATDEACTFHLNYVASQMDPEEMVMDVSVDAGEQAVIEIPCAEIIGLGSLTTVGVPAADLEHGTKVSNMMSVPGFLGSDYTCGETYACALTADTEDLDGDGDTDELIVTTDAFHDHAGPEGMGGHMHNGHHGP